jgi:O-antigen ligase
MRTRLKQALITGTHAPVKPTWPESLFVIAALLLLSRAWSSTLFTGVAPGEVAAATNAPVRLLLFLSIYAISGLLLLVQWRAVMDALLRQKFMFLLLALTLVSPLWSVNTAESIEKTAGILGGSVFALYLAYRLDTDVMLHLLAIALAVMVVGSYVMALMFPESGLMQGNHQGLWRGVFQHKNHLGLYTVIAGAKFFTMALRQGAYRGYYLTGFLLAFALLALSTSKTSILSWTIVFCVLCGYAFYTGRKRFGLLAIATSALILGCFVLQTQARIMAPIVLDVTVSCIESKAQGESAACNIIPTAQALAPRSSDFSTGRGRIELWQHLWTQIQQRPVLGYSPGGFWLGMDGPSAYIWEREPWHPASSHNGFVELTVHLGFVGLALFLLGTVPLVLGVIQRGLRKTLSATGTVYGAMLAALLLGNLGESMLLSPNKLPWVLMVLLTFGLYRQYSASITGSAAND